MKRILSNCIGSAENTLLRARIFHTVSIIALIGLLTALFINSFVNLPWVNLILSATWILTAVSFVLSRVFGKLRIGLILFSIGTSVFMIFNYFVNAGIGGPTLLLFLLSFAFTSTLMPTRQIWGWMFYNLAITGSLIIFEYLNPDFVQFSYNERSALFLDKATTYVCVVLCMGAVLFFLIHSYEREKANALKASQALQAANDSKTRLFSVLSHDLRSPLNSIAGYLETLNEFELSDEERQSLERHLLDETKSMQVMLHNLLSWTKAQMDGGTKVNLTKINLSAGLAECLSLQQAAAARKSILIHTRVDPEMVLYADRDMLKLVIQNLVNNAIKFTPSGGEIKIYSQQEPGVIKLHISDNGVGIPLDQQANLFTFHASSSYGTNNEKGVGLGLILCKEYTEMQNGRISFSSQPDKGTTFSLEFDV